MGRQADFELLGIGFGPANLALAIAIEELSPAISAHFIEANSGPAWQAGLLLPGADIQHHPVRDLVTPRNPRSRYSFINYLHETGRLFEFLNVPLHFPLRKEYARYIAWTAAHFAEQVDYGVRASAIETLPDGRFLVRADTAEGDTAEYTASALVVAPGRSRYIPPVFADVLSDRVVHASDYLYRIDDWMGAGARHVVVLGASQSACEVVLDLTNREPGVRITNLMRSFGYRLKDTSPFMEEVYFPEFVDYYYQASQEGKDDLDRQLRATNYSSVDEDILHRLYARIYEQRLDGDQRVFVTPNRDVMAVEPAGDASAVRLLVQERHTGEHAMVKADAVVLATGFRDLGPGPQQEPCPPLLAGLQDRLHMAETGQVWVGPDYELAGEGVGPLYLNGLCESTHGMGDAGSFSLLALRAARIVGSLQRSLDRLASRPAAQDSPALAAAAGA
jgi:L-ornithine N5-oxygenase